MKMLVLVTLLSLCFGLMKFANASMVPTKIFNSDPNKNWAMLVAGSNGWWNYRHQADVFHAYQILKKRGIPESNIILMAYDDIAYNSENPFKGKIFNDYQEKDVYAGVKIDYKEEDVTPEMFMRVMKGDSQLAAQGKKVLKSGSEDNVFVFFSDHGSDGCICFPDGDLYAADLNDTLAEMFEKKRYAQMVLYIEACYSGSMFRNILSDKMNIYATTAANHEESSWGAFCHSPDLDTCLADDYSHNWMADSESHNLQDWTLDQQFEAVRAETKKSHVMKYGDMSMGSVKTAQFQTHHQHETHTSDEMHPKSQDRQPAHTAHLVGMAKRLMGAKTDKHHQLAKQRLHRAMQMGRIVKEIVEEIEEEINQLDHLPKTTVDEREKQQCFKSVFKLFSNKCFSVQQVPEVAQYTPRFQELCRQGYSVQTLKAAILNACA